MAHPRKLARDAVTAALTNATAAATRVFPTRVDPIRNTKLPAISVSTTSEEIVPEKSDTAPRELHRVVKLEIVGFVAHTSSVPVDDAMDAIAEQIEAAAR